VLHNLFVHAHEVPKSWMSTEDLISPDFDVVVDSNVFLSEN